MPLKVKCLPSTQQNLIDDLTMVFFISYRNRLTLLAYLIDRLIFPRKKDRSRRKIDPLIVCFPRKKGMGFEKDKDVNKINLNLILTCINCYYLFFFFEGFISSDNVFELTHFFFVSYPIYIYICTYKPRLVFFFCLWKSALGAE